MRFELDHVEALPESKSDELARVVVARFGLTPRKKDGKAGFHTLLLELSERKKMANRDKKPETAVMPVEDMGIYAGVKRQTMYDYLRRWLQLGILKKTSFVSSGKVIIGYELNGTNLEAAFKKAQQAIMNHTEQSLEVVRDLQTTIKKEKLRQNPRYEEEEQTVNQPEAVIQAVNPETLSELSLSKNQIPETNATVSITDSPTNPDSTSNQG